MTTLVFLAALAFAATNVDDFLVLLSLFADSALKPTQIVAGQLIGTSMLTIFAIALGSSASRVAESWTHLLGMLPLAIGLHRLIVHRAFTHSDLKPAGDSMRKISIVTAVTVANGGDNLAAYVPVLVGRSAIETTVMAAVFGGLTTAWCLAAWLIVRRAPRAWTRPSPASRLVPWIYVGLGVYLLAT